MMFLRKSTASQEILLGTFLDSTDGVTPETGLTIANTDIKLFKSGATAEANKNSGGATHIAAGRYYAVLDATDTNTTGLLEINVSVAGALPVRRSYTVLAAAVYDALVDGTGNLSVTAATVSDKTGYSLSQSFPANFADLSISATTGLVNITQTAADKTWGTAARTLTAGTNITLAKGTGITGLNDLSTADVASATWNAATATYGTGGSYGALIELNLDAQVSGATAPTAAAVADAVWDEALSGHLTAGSTGSALNAAGSSGDPWATTLPGAYGAGSAGKIIGDNVNAAIGTVQSTVTAIKAVTDVIPNSGTMSSIATQSTLTSTQSNVNAIKAKTDNLPAAPAATSDIPSASSIRSEIDSNSTQLAAIVSATGTTNSTLSGTLTANINQIDGSATAAAYLKLHALRAVPVTFLAGGTTTTAVFNLVDGAAASGVNDVYNGRVLIFSTPTNLKDQACAITSYDGATKTATITAVTNAPVATANAMLV
jgi:hypothetical protein